MHGGFYCGPDRYNPGTLQDHKWENAMTVDTVSWGIRRDIHLRAILTMDELLTTVIETISCGGNMLINVGPTREGNILPIFQERLKSLGDWLKVNTSTNNSFLRPSVCVYLFLKNLVKKATY